MQRIVINTRYGGFGLSAEARAELLKEGEYENDLPRDKPELVAVVERLGSRAGNSFAELKVVEIPDDVEWEIAEYDGMEWVAEKHRTWR